MTVKCTSKASLRDEKEKGNILSQAQKIFSLMSIGGDFSLQEIMAIYRGRYGAIEYGSISGRCNKLKKDKRIFEVGTRRCSITGKIINCLSIREAR